MKVAVGTNQQMAVVETRRRRAFTGETINAGLWSAALANLLWGASFLASKYTLAAWGPFTASSLRFAIATAATFLGLQLFGRHLEVPRSRRDWFYVFLVAKTGFGFLYPTQLAGLKLISSGLSAAIMLTSPLFVILVGHFLLKDRITKNKMIALFIGLAGGIFLLQTNGSFHSTLNTSLGMGSLLTLGASLSLAISVIATRKLAGRLDSASLTFWSMGIGFVQLAVSAFTFEEESLANFIQTSTPQAWTALLFLAIVCSAFCFFIWNFALSKASPKEIASTMQIKTPAAVLIGAIVAGEHVTTGLIFGTGIVMFGVWLSQQKAKGNRA